MPVFKICLEQNKNKQNLKKKILLCLFWYLCKQYVLYYLRCILSLQIQKLHILGKSITIMPILYTQFSSKSDCQKKVSQYPRSSSEVLQRNDVDESNCTDCIYLAISFSRHVLTVLVRKAFVSLVLKPTICVNRLFLGFVY